MTTMLSDTVWTSPSFVVCDEDDDGEVVTRFVDTAINLSNQRQPRAGNASGEESVGDS
jgi:hypothetical protein